MKFSRLLAALPFVSFALTASAETRTWKDAKWFAELATEPAK